MSSVQVEARASKLEPRAARTQATGKGDFPRKESVGLADDVVNRASNESFPASDAPAWINGEDPAE
jgi:hypothetical protein